MSWGRGIYKEYRENSNEISRGDGKTVSNGKKENRKNAVLMRKMWTTELDRTERWRNMNTWPPYFLNHCSPLLLNTEGDRRLNLELWCSQTDVPPFVPDESAVGRGQRHTSKVDWLEPTLQVTEKPRAEGRHRGMLWVILLPIPCLLPWCQGPTCCQVNCQGSAVRGDPPTTPPPLPPGESLTSGIQELVECCNMPFLRHTVLKGVPFISKVSFVLHIFPSSLTEASWNHSSDQLSVFVSGTAS